ncbi:aspartic peptidase domain-containing protein [Dipodascopsis uninucleata]
MSFPLQTRISDHYHSPHMAISKLLAESIRQEHGQVVMSPHEKSKTATSNQINDGTRLSHRSAIYTITVGVGSPPQEQSLLLDTGSSDLMIFAASSSQCQKSSWGCGGGYNPSASSTFKNLNMSFLFGFGNESATARGSFVQDHVHLGDYVIENQPIAMVEDSILDFDIEGVLGLGYQNRQQSDFKYDTIASRFYSKDGLSKKPIYSLYLDSRRRSPTLEVSNTKLKHKNIRFAKREKEDDIDRTDKFPQASLDVGFIDSNKYRGDMIAFVPFTTKDDFTVKIESIKFQNGTKLASRSRKLRRQASYSEITRRDGSPIETEALLDSGTVGIHLDDDIADNFAKCISRDAIYDESLPGYRIPCSAVINDNKDMSEQDYFQFEFPVDYASGLENIRNKKIIKVSISELFRTTSDGSQCMLDIVRESTYGVGNILGTAFLSSVYAVFDFTQNRVGLAQATYYEGSFES